MVPMIKFDDGKEFFYEHRDTDLSRSPIMGNHHYHSFFEIYYFEKGECRYFIDDRTYSLLPGDVILIPEGVIHRTLYTADYERKLLNFSKDFIPPSIEKTLPSMFYLYRNPNVANEIKNVFAAIEKEYANLDKYSSDALQGLTYSLFFLLARNENMAKQNGGNSEFVAKAVKLIGNAYSTNITLAAVADMFSVSSEHLSRTFKKETGFGFNEYLTLVRLQKAEQMLSEENAACISDVAYACGFNDSNYFSDKFKKAYGVSPLKFKQKK